MTRPMLFAASSPLTVVSMLLGADQLIINLGDDGNDQLRKKLSDCQSKDAISLRRCASITLQLSIL